VTLQNSFGGALAASRFAQTRRRDLKNILRRSP
jgi:hypothetical protein